jgi:hypothetical protein
MGVLTRKEQTMKARISTGGVLLLLGLSLFLNPFVLAGEGPPLPLTSAPADAANFKIIVYGQVWAYQDFSPAQVDWNGIDIHILFQETSVLTSPPYFSLIGNTADSAEYENGRGGATSILGRAVRDSLHAHGAKHLVTIYTVTDATGMDYVAADSARTEAFARNVVAWCQRHGVDGVDFDWEGSNASASNRRRAQRIIYRNLHAAGMIFVIPGGRFEQKLWNPDYCDYMVPQYYSWDQVYSGCVGGSYNVIAYANALQVGSNDPCTNYLQGAGLRDSLRLTGYSESDVDPAYHGGPASFVRYGWPKAKMGAGYGTYGSLFTALSDTTPWQTPQNGWNNYQTSIRIQDIRKAYVGKPGVHLTYDAVREAWSIRGRPTQNLDGGTWPANSLGFMTIPTNDNIAKWTQWLVDQGYGAIMLYGMYEDYQPDSASGRGRFAMLETVKRTLGRLGGPTNPPPSGSISANPLTLPAGGGSLTLTWTSSNATSASINPGVGAVGSSGSTVVSVTTSTTFVLSLSGPGGSATYSVSVQVNPPPSGSISANPSSLPTGGGSVTLQWSSTNATGATLSPGVGAVAVNGSRVVSVTSSTTFTLSLTGPGGTASATAQVNVGAQSTGTAVFDDSLHGPFTEQSWGVTLDMASTQQVYAGQSSIRVDFVDWGGFGVLNGSPGSEKPFDRSQYDSVRFSIYPTSNLQLSVGFQSGGHVETNVNANRWTRISSPLPTTPSPKFWIQNYQATATTAFLDEIALVPAALKTDVQTADRIPAAYALSQNFPNPFNPATTIEFSLPEAGNATLVVYDVLGREIDRPLSTYLPPGIHSILWDAKGRSSGVYFYRLQVNDFSNIRRMTVLK